MPAHEDSTRPVAPGSEIGPSRAVAIVGSAGGIIALLKVLRGLSSAPLFPIFVAQHLARFHRSNLPAILGWHTGIKAKWAEDGEIPENGIVYVAPPKSELQTSNRRLVVRELDDQARSWLPSSDALLSTVSESYGPGAIGIALSGMIPVGIAGLRAIRARGGITMAQNEASAMYFDLPRAAIELGKVEIVYSPERIAQVLNLLIQNAGRAH